MEPFVHSASSSSLKLLSLENFKGETPKFNLPNLEILHFLPSEEHSHFSSLIKMVSNSPNIKELELQVLDLFSSLTEQGYLSCQSDDEFNQFATHFKNLRQLQLVLSSWQLTEYPRIEGYIRYSFFTIHNDFV